MEDEISPSMSIWFWQRMVSPHMVALADSLARDGFDVTFVANERISQDRAAQGWVVPRVNRVKVLIANDVSSVRKIILSAPRNSIHICQGIRGNGLVNDARKMLYEFGMSQWVIMEGVDDRGVLGIIKRSIYRTLFILNRSRIDGILAIGEKTKDWIVEQGFPKDKIYPFAYFLKDHIIGVDKVQKIASQNPRSFTIIYVGQLIERKCVDLLILAIAALEKNDIELWVFGGGALNSQLVDLASLKLPNKVRWFGVCSILEIRSFMGMADCLVLPSRHDGWGAVVSESLMVGTQVICSDACGASIVVRESNSGAVFPSGDLSALTSALLRQYEYGKWSSARRIKLAQWAKCLGANSGAVYLSKILTYQIKNGIRPHSPWFGSGGN